MSETNIREVPLDLIDASQRNPRRVFTHVDELAESIDAYGLLQPIVLRQHGKRFEVVAGHRRVAAARELGWTTIPALVRTADESEALILTLIETCNEKI